MAVKDIIARGIGFSPGSIKFIITHGFIVGAAVAPPVLQPAIDSKILLSANSGVEVLKASSRIKSLSGSGGTKTLKGSSGC